MCGMARRLPSLARGPLSSLSPTRSGSESIRRSLSTSLGKLTDRQPAFKHPSPSSSPQRQQEVTLAPWWTKRLNLSKRVPDDRTVNPGHTIFTSPGATKTSVVDSISLLEMPSDRGQAVVIFASPRHASWLTDTAFMAHLVQKLFQRRPDTDQRIHVLAAVVDGLYPKFPGREMQEGLSVQFGTLDRLLPGLWDGALEETPQTQARSGGPGSESAYVSVVLRQSAYHRETHTVSLPLANTLFHNGRRTTLLASEWQSQRLAKKGIKLLRMTEKRGQKVDLPMLCSEETQQIHMRCPLVPITYPRKIVEGLGNILAKVDIEGVPSPASKELQVNIPRLLQERQSRSDYNPETARIGVWALIIPESLIVDDEVQQQTSSKASRGPSSNSRTKIRAGRLGTAGDKLAFEMTLASDRTAWQNRNVMGEILCKGGRLHQILSGGGEWGAKASLLSLDPQTTYGVESEEDDLDRFQRSFHGEDAVDGAITRPGDFVQFFVEGDTEVSLQGPGLKKLVQSTSSLPRAAFGVGEFSKEEHIPERVDSSVRDQRALTKVAPNHFGAFSAAGIYLDMRSGHSNETTTTTKVNTPGTMIHPSTSGTGKRGAPGPRSIGRSKGYMSL